MSTEQAPVGYTNGTSFAWNTRGQTIAAATILPALGLISVALRFWSRIHKRTGFELDDAFIVPALSTEKLCVIGLGVLLLVGVSNNVIAHTTPPDPNTANDPNAQLDQITPQEVLVQKIEYAFFLLVIAAYGFVKLSVLFFYRRIFIKGTSSASRFDIVSKVAIGLTSAWTIAFFLAQLLQCGRYINENWGPLGDSAHCFNDLQYTSALFVSDLITDLVVICLPIPIILRLHMSTERKLGTIGVLLLGAMSIGASIVRIVYGFQIQAAGLAKPTDVDEGLTTLFYWGMLEAGISLIATNLPSLHFLATKQSLQSFAHSLHNAISIGSLRSDRSDTRVENGVYSKMRQSRSKSSDGPIAVEGRREAAGSFAMYDVERAAVPGAIHVTKEFSPRGKMF